MGIPGSEQRAEAAVDYVLVEGVSPEALRADFDADGDVDLADYLAVMECFSSSGVLPPVDCGVCMSRGRGCRGGLVYPPDLDRDGDVDLADLVAFQAAFTGSQ